MNACIILGTGGFAREVYWHIRQSKPNYFDDFFFVDDITNHTTIKLDREYTIINNWDFSKLKTMEVGFIVGVGYPAVKEIMVNRALIAGLRPLPTFVHPSSIILDPNCQLGYGGIITAGCILTSNIKLGNYVGIDRGTTIGHDVIIEDLSHIAPLCSISGNVKLGTKVFLGTGTVIKEKIKIANGVMTGAQSCVVKEATQENGTFIGIPSKLIV
jgi:sugar O-acyltransferase (sialic acid O-acetyltransferase NeuD family)